MMKNESGNILNNVTGNLFFIHTPFQLFVAQQLIHDQKLKNNCMVYGYIDKNEHFLNIYNIIRIDSMWKSCFFIENIASWPQIDFRNILHTNKEIKKTDTYIKEIIKRNNISDIYFGDMNNRSYQLLSFVYSKRGLHVNFFEEGSSHYVNLGHCASYGNYLYRLSKSIISDLLIYKRYWGLCFGKWIYFKTMDYSLLPINKRYSFVPYYYKENFDVIIHPSLLLSDKLKAIISEEVSNINLNNVILFLSEPLDETSSDSYKMELETIRIAFSDLSKDNVILIKFHPRENVFKQKEILKIFSNLGFNYRVISQTINVPVEYYLQLLNFKDIYTFLCSTSFYNGYIYKKTRIHTLLPVYYPIIKKSGSPYIGEIEKIMADQRIMKLFVNIK